LHNNPFGNLTSSSGSLAATNTYRFSSKEFIASVSLYSYLYRFYDPSLQRWLNRDPIEEWGSINLFGYCSNDSVNWIDFVGLDVEFSGDAACQKVLKHNYNLLKSTDKGKELTDKLEKSKDKYVIKPTKDDAYFDPKTKTINIDPNFHPVTQTANGPQQAQTVVIMGHELGHAATGTKDDGNNSMNNVNENENPIRKQLNLPGRTKY